MNKHSQYLILAGIGLLTIVILVLVTSPSALFSPMVTVIGNNLNQAQTNQISVVTKGDFTDPEKIKKFPYDIGKWHGTDYPTDYATRVLGADSILIRGYDPETFTQPLFLTVVQSKTDSSFHRPEYCFKSQGYDTQEIVKEDLVIDNNKWVKEETRPTIPIERLVSTKSSDKGSIIERRLTLFFYVKGNQFYSDMITMIEVQGLIPLHGSYDGTLKEARDFLAMVIPLMFDPAENNSLSQGRPLIWTLAHEGVAGYAGITVMLLVPIAIIAYPLLRRKGTAR